MVGGVSVARLRNNDVWAFTEQFNDAAITRTDGAVDVYQVTTEARVIHRFPAVDSRTGRTCALLISQKTGRSPLFVAYGTADGNVFMQGRHAVRLDGSPSNLCSNDNALFTCDMHAKTVVAIDLASGNVTSRFEVAAHHIGKLSFLALSPKRSIFAVCSQFISIHSVSDGKLIKSFVGHPSPISAATFFRNDSLLLTGSRDDHHLFLWDVSDESSDQELLGNTRSSGKKKRRRKTSANTTAHTFVAPESGVRSIAVSDAQTEDIFIAALLKSGLIAIWRWDVSTDGGSSKPVCHILPCVENSKDGAPSIHGIGFQSPQALSILYGNNLKPKVHSVSVTSAHGKVYLPSPGLQNLFVNQSAALRDGQVTDIEACTQTTTRAEAEAPDAVGSVPKAMENGNSGNEPAIQRSSTEGMNIVAEQNGVMSEQEDASESDGEENVENQMLTERLASLGVSSINTRQVSTASLVEVPKGTGDESSNSKARLIEQALASKDDVLLSSIICKKQDQSTISSSVRVLAAEVATGALLNELAKKLRSNPRDVTKLMAWIREIIFEHSNALAHMRDNSAIQQIAVFAQARLDNLPALMRLQGRLELIERYASRARRLRQSRVANGTPQLEYIELEEQTRDGNSSDAGSSEEDSNEEESPSNSGESSSDGE